MTCRKNRWKTINIFLLRHYIIIRFLAIPILWQFIWYIITYTRKTFLLSPLIICTIPTELSHFFHHYPMRWSAQNSHLYIYNILYIYSLLYTNIKDDLILYILTFIYMAVCIIYISIYLYIVRYIKCALHIFCILKNNNKWKSYIYNGNYKAKNEIKKRKSKNRKKIKLII